MSIIERKAMRGEMNMEIDLRMPEVHDMTTDTVDVVSTSAVDL